MRQQPERRSAAEWAQLVGAWKASGLPLKAFAARQRLKPATLSWWKWKLGSSTQASEPVVSRLLPVEVVGADIEATEDGWELRGRGDFVLRVDSPLTDSQLELLLSFLVTDA